MEFYEELLIILNEQVESGNNVVVAGDWNTAHKEIDLARPKDNVKNSGFLPEERAMLDKYIEHGYVDTFRLFHPEPDRYSWWTYRFGARDRNVGWRIDYFWANEAFTDHIVDADIHDKVMGSDHCPVSLEIREN
jgi:exodeoxyribonuclease-3